MKKILLTLGLLLASTLGFAQGGGQFGGSSSSSGGSGTVGNCTAAGNAYYATSGTTTSCDLSIVDNGTGTLTLGTVAGNAGVITFNGTTSGTVSLSTPVTGGILNSNGGLSFTGASGAATTINTTTTNASLFLTPNGTGIVTIGNLGTATNPSLQWTTQASNTGLFGTSTGVCFTSTGSNADCLVNGGVEVGSAKFFAFSSTTGGTGAVDTPICRLGAGISEFGSGASCGSNGYFKSAQTLLVTAADVTCGTGGTLAPCTSLTTIPGLTATLPLVATNWSFYCDLIVSQVTAAAADQIGIQTATNGATNLTAAAEAYTAAAVVADASLTDVASTTVAQSLITFTPGATGTKVPIHLAGTMEGVSAAGTVFNVMVLTGAAADLLTVYRGSQCWLF